MDKVIGGKGDDVLVGSDGDDRIVGGAGDDTLIGGEGDDKLTGGSGDDLFVFEVGFGNDEITDFKTGEGSIDRILLRDTEATDFASVLALATEINGHVLITFSNGDTLLIKGAKIADLHEDDFIFETSLQPLFTPNNDTVDFNAVTAGTYVDGTQYDALGGDDTVTLAASAAAAAAAGYVVGTAFNAGDGNDTVTGGALDDIINGDAGNDTLSGGTGSDTLNGGAGDDRLSLDDINVGDSVDGGADTDTFVFSATAGAAHNIIAGFAGVFVVDGTTISVTNVENFEITGAELNDTIVGAAGDDILIGLGGNDGLFADGGDNIVDAGDGNDVIRVFDGNNTVDGGNGNDQLAMGVVSADITADMNVGTAIVSGAGTTNFTGIETIVTGAGNDVVTGDANSNGIFVDGGDNIVDAGDGNDVIRVFDGNNTVDGGNGNDQLLMNVLSADITADFNLGTAAVSGAGTTNFANIEVLATGSGDDAVVGDANSNSINVGAGNNTVDAGDGVDVVFLLDGNNTVDGGASNDQLSWTGVTADITVDLTLGAAAVSGAGTTNFVNFENYITGSGDDTFIGDGASSGFFGQAGNDTFNSGAGNDTMVGGSGDDLFIFNVGDGGDRINDFTAGAGSEDVIDISAFGFASFGDVLAASTDSGANVIIDLDNAPGGDSLLLINVNVADLASDDFII